MCVFFFSRVGNFIIGIFTELKVNAVFSRLLVVRLTLLSLNSLILLMIRCRATALWSIDIQEKAELCAVLFLPEQNDSILQLRRRLVVGGSGVGLSYLDDCCEIVLIRSWNRGWASCYRFCISDTSELLIVLSVSFVITLFVISVCTYIELAEKDSVNSIFMCRKLERSPNTNVDLQKLRVLVSLVITELTSTFLSILWQLLTEYVIVHNTTFDHFPYSMQKCIYSGGIVLQCSDGLLNLKQER